MTQMTIISDIRIKKNQDTWSRQFFPVEVSYEYRMTQRHFTWTATAHELFESIEEAQRHHRRRDGAGIRFCIEK